jgi:phage protein U
MLDDLDLPNFAGLGGLPSLPSLPSIPGLGNLPGMPNLPGLASLPGYAGLMPQMMMTLGLFVFGLYTVPYQQLARQTQWRHPSASRVGRRPARQYIGPGDDTIDLSGTLYPELTGGRISLALLREMADTGKAWPLIQGDGTFYGLFIIENITETGSVFFPDGAARKIDFGIKLTRVDDEEVDLLGAMTESLMALL